MLILEFTAVRRCCAFLLTTFLLASCVTPHREPSQAQDLENSLAHDATWIEVDELARRHGFKRRGLSKKGRIELARMDDLVEIDPASRVAYLNGKLSVMDRWPQEKAGILYVSRALDAQLKSIPKKVAKPKKDAAAVVLKKTKPIPHRRSLRGKCFVIDAGHGGKDPGALQKGAVEKVISLNVAQKLASLLKAEGAEVVMTRNQDRFVSLDGRVRISNNTKPDAFVSIHVNSANNTQASGVEIYRASFALPGQQRGKIGRSRRLAAMVYRNLERKSRGQDRGVKRSPGFRVLKKNNHPAILVELGFLSNRQDRLVLGADRYQQQLAQALFAGLLDYVAST